MENENAFDSKKSKNCNNANNQYSDLLGRLNADIIKDNLISIVILFNNFNL